MKLKKFIKASWKYLTNPSYRFRVNAGFGRYNKMSDEEYLKKMFCACMGVPLNLDNPQTFNEKLQWLKLYDRKPEYTMMVDKYLVRDYIKEKLGEEYLIPLLGVWDKPEDIDFEKLPNQFVLKCNHNSGLGMYICKDKSKLTKKDIKKIRKDLAKGLAQDYYLSGREWPYKNVPRKIICEKYMVDSSTPNLYDYKFFCFNGLAKCYKVDFDRFINHRANYFSKDGDLLKFGEDACPPDFNKKLPLSKNIKKMEKFASQLSKSHPFLRVDFYDVNGQIYFGELTFYPASGFGQFIYDGNDELFGSWIEILKSSGGGQNLLPNL